MFSRNQDNPLSIEKGFSELSLHPFENNAECMGEWCLHREDPTKKYKSLPYDKHLTNTELQEDIAQIFDRLKKQSESHGWEAHSQRKPIC